MVYERCDSCSSLFVAERPSAEALKRHYQSSAASAFRVDYFVAATASARFGHIIQSRVDWIDQILSRYHGRGSVRLADIGTLYPGIFAELRDLAPVVQLASLEIDARVADHLPTDIQRDAASAPFQAICAFEQLEHQFSPRESLERWNQLLDRDGMLLLTTRTISGFDLQTLYDRTSYLLIPEHLNLMSMSGLERLLATCGFEIVELSTPGELDVQLVREGVRADPTIRVSDFLKTLLFDRGDEALTDFQSFLQKHRLSSHVRIAARRSH
jgi:hypothetical protein